jgi:DNA-binding LacI/PurR family transcriptional regulator
MNATSSVTSIKPKLKVYQRLLLKLRHLLDGQNMQPGRFFASEHDLARRERVSRRSVRHAVDILVREGRLERKSGKGLYIRQPGSVTHWIQVVVPTLAAHLCIEMAGGVKAAAVKVGVQTQIYDAHGSFDSDLEALRQLPATAARGAIIWSLHHRRFAEVLYELKAARYPFVLVDESLRDIEVPTVLADNYRGGYLVGRELIQRGHRRIGYISFPADTTRLRAQGVQDALTDANLLFDRSLNRELRTTLMEDSSAEIDRLTRELLHLPDRPTAIFYNNDHAAIRGYETIRTLGLRIPEDVSVVGFDGEPLCRLLTPTLTTIRQPAREMGMAAMEILLDLMAGGKGGADNMAGDNLPHQVLPITWQEGGSIGPAPCRKARIHSVRKIQRQQH